MQELLHKVLFAFVSGFSELIFTSTSAHQLLYRTVTEYNFGDHFLSLGIHLGCLIALLINCKNGSNICRMRNGWKDWAVAEEDVSRMWLL